MGKPNINERYLRGYSGSPDNNAAMFYAALELQQFDRKNSFIDPETKAYVLYGVGHNFYEEEMEIARGFAKNNVNVILTSENNMMLSRRFVLDAEKRELKPRFAEGTVNGIIYEQKTTDFTAKNFVTNVKAAINHANDARADIAVIYDKYGLMHSYDIEEGMKKYQERNPRTWGKGVKAVIVFDKDLNMYEHQFDK